MSAAFPPRFPLLPALGVAGLLVFGDAVTRLSYWGRTRRDDGLILLDATVESSLPTWFTILVTLAVGIVAWRRGTIEGRPWRVMGLLFIYLAFDDTLSLHERFGELVHGSVGDHGTYAWILTLAPVFAGLGLWCAWHLWSAMRQWPQQRRLLLFGCAALGLALVGEAIEDCALRSALRLRGIPLVCYTQWCEEALEVFAPVLLLGAVWPTRATEPSPVPGHVRYIGIDR